MYAGHSYNSSYSYLYCRVIVVYLKYYWTSYWLSQGRPEEFAALSYITLQCLFLKCTCAVVLKHLSLLLSPGFSDTFIDCLLVLIIFLPVYWCSHPHALTGLTVCEQGNEQSLAVMKFLLVTAVLVGWLWQLPSILALSLPSPLGGGRQKQRWADTNNQQTLCTSAH